MSHGGPFDSVVVKRAVQNCLARPSVEPAPQQVPCDFASVYCLALRRLMAGFGWFGPCDIYDPQYVSLLVSRLGSKNACLDWRLFEKKWKVGRGPAAMVRFLGLLKGRRSHALACRRISNQLRSRNLPPISGVSCPVPRLSCLNVFS